MSRNASEYITEAFRPLAEAANRGDLLPKLKTKDLSEDIKEEEIKKFKEIQLSGEPVFWINFSIIKATYENAVYLFLVGAGDIPNGRSEIDEFSEARGGFLRAIQPSEFLLLRHKLLKRYRLKPNYSTQHSAYNIIGMSEEDGYVGHDIDDLMQMHQEVFCLEFDANSSISDSDTLVTCLDICNNCPSLRSQVIDQNLCTKITDLNSYDLVPSENLFDAITSNHLRQSFLELYRVLESIFELPFLIKLSKEINTTLDIKQLSNVIENLLSWRRKEEDSIIETLELCDESTLFDNKILETSTFSEFKETPNKAAIAKRIYKIRNSIVHHKVRYETNSFSVNSEDWETIVLFTTMILDDVCQKLAGKH